ncbi:DUF4232 domain-containing protein [Saccharopolyspora sp. WRP15-2]|uniref:DUF4232 domain-containing protein n=1 Tax=Saccharopolyspora oryzae TaxID=2997343 RepID=A0ABT4UW40_9PSEU|nr:DUF4232 domain-containing protein [Saccharopolyspora oryzae]MDA3625947.1 DUF4232 domain-containing protein [Saccharopolyspora oryzae]
MTAHRLRTIGLRTLQASGALLAAGLMAACSQAPQTGKVVAAPIAHPQPQPPAAAMNLQQPAETPQAPQAESPQPSPTASDPTTAQAPPKKQEPQGAKSTRCHTSMLNGSLQNADAGAGQRYAELTLTNNSGETCTLYGYGGMQLVDSSGRALPTNAERTPNPGPSMITLAPGASASATLHWTVVPTGDEPTDGQCQPTPARLQVIPPDETDALPVAWNSGPVCGGGTIDGSAYHQ